MTAAPIRYDRPVTNLIAGLDKTGHVTHTRYRKTSVTVHHNGGRLSHQGVLNVWKVRPASAHFDVDSSGAVAQYVGVNEYAWATGNTRGNQTSISIEMCNATVAPRWEVSETTWKSAARLAAWLLWKVVGQRPSKTNLKRHSDWSSTACPGPFMGVHWDEFVKEAQLQYDKFVNPVTERPVPQTLSARVRAFQTLLEVTSDGKWGDLTDDRAQRMRAACMKHTYAGRFTFDIRDVQKVIDTEPDGVWGKNSQAKLELWVPQAQRLIGVKDDGVWGEGTDAAFWEFRKRAQALL